MEGRGVHMSKKEMYEARTEELITPILDRRNFELVDVEYVKEGSTWYLRVYIDKEGGITSDDCADVSREMNEILDREELEAIFKEFDNPEMINNCPDTAPSKRLKRIIKGYNKIVYGNILAEAIGLTGIKAKCPRFNNWITIISSIVKPLHP